MQRAWTTVLILALVAGCAGKAPVAPVADQQTGTVAARLPVHLATLTGVAQAPAKLLGNNSSGVVSNAGAAVVSNAGAAVVANHGGAFKLADAEGWQGVAAAQVVALDARKQPLPGVKAVATDASGRFTLENVPANVVVTVQITAGTLVLTGLAKADGTKADVNPATTLATEHIRARFDGNEAALSHVPLEQFRQLTVAVQAVLQTEGVDVPLASPADVGKSFAKIVEGHPEIATQERAVAKGATQALETAIKAGDAEPTPGPAAQPTSTPTPRASARGEDDQGEDEGNHAPPEHHPSPSPSAPPAEGATPTPAQTGTPHQDPTPRPSATGGTTQAPRGEAALSQLLATKACPSCDLSDQELDHADLAGANLQGAKLRGADLHYAKLAGANLQGADLTAADLHYADLRGANLRNAAMRNVDGHHAKLDNADLTGATMGGGDFDLDDATLGGATWKDGTKCGPNAVETCTP